MEGSLSQESANEFQVHLANGKRISIFLSSIDVQKLNNSSLMNETSKFAGSPLIFLDLPKVRMKIFLQTHFFRCCLLFV